MDYWYIYIFIAFVLSAAMSGFIIPHIRAIAFSRKLFDKPNTRKIHDFLVPRLGGIAFAPIIIFVLFFLIGVSLKLNHNFISDAFFSETVTLSFSLCAVMCLYVIGLADDLIGVKYRIKFLVQILSALLVVFCGLYIKSLYGILFIDKIPDILGILTTVLLLVFIVNSINLIDGIDGLASGLSIIVLIIYGTAFIFFSVYVYALLAFAVAGAIIPFFYFNVFGSAERGKKIFMGDTGSLTVGLIICILGLKLLNIVPETKYVDINPIMFVYSPLIIPCFDVIRVFMRRMRKQKNPFLPDRSHIHHKLLRTGLSKSMIIIVIFSISVIITIFNILLTQYINVNFVIVTDIVLWIFANVYLTHIINRKGTINTIE